MKLSSFDLDNVNHWDAYTTSINEDVYDIVIINYSRLKIELTFKFKRFKTFCYYDTFKDYGYSYIKDNEYIELYNQLSKNAAYVSNQHYLQEILL